ncbi:rCG46502 [Rattus norvegicus]|uniref:RCG46502 n=1 Tax=Rattus norvegicus TaxID=10116 RepID=A6IDN4_RAT|nr:rCG46502 [Rattus norvegicus]
MSNHCCVVQLFAWMPCLKTLRRLRVSGRGSASPLSRMRTGAGLTGSELDEARKTSEKVSPPPPLLS